MVMMIIGSVLEPAANSIVNTFIDKSHFHKQMQATQKQVTTINIGIHWLWNAKEFKEIEI